MKYERKLIETIKTRECMRKSSTRERSHISISKDPAIKKPTNSSKMNKHSKHLSRSLNSVSKQATIATFQRPKLLAKSSYDLELDLLRLLRLK